jgi:hypothetical protein
MPPGVSVFDSPPNLGGGYIVKIARQPQQPDAIAEFFRNLKSTLPVGHQQMKLLEHPIHCAGIAVIPRENSFRGITSADEMDLRIGTMKLTSHINEQAAFGYGRVEARAAQHRQSIIQASAMKLFVWIRPGNDAQNFIDQWLRGVH